MKKIFKIFIYVFAGIIVLAVGGYVYMMTQYPKVIPPPDLKITPTAEMIERGKYLAYGFAACMDCHSTRDFSKFTGPIVPGSEGKGGEDFSEGVGLVIAKNITPDKETGLGNWTDGEIFRAITMGLDKDGEALGPMMPYPFYRNFNEQDIYAIIAFIKTLKPIKNETPKHSFNFPLNLIFRTLPSEPDFKKLPDKNNKLELGSYYAGSCMICHSPMEKGEFIKEKLFSGGVAFPLPKGGYVKSSNISPDKETGIGNWTKEEFIKKFKSYQLPENQNIPVKDGEFNTVMPWIGFSTCTEEDLGAVYDFIMTHEPVKNKVEKFSATGFPQGN